MVCVRALCLESYVGLGIIRIMNYTVSFLTQRGVRVVNLLFIDQYFRLTEYLHVVDLPSINILLIFTAFHNKLNFPSIQKIFLYTSRGVV